MVLTFLGKHTETLILYVCKPVLQISAIWFKNLGKKTFCRHFAKFTLKHHIILLLCKLAPIHRGCEVAEERGRSLQTGMCSFWCWKQEKFVLLIAKPKGILCSETSTWKAFSGSDVSVLQGSICQRFWKLIQSERPPHYPPRPPPPRLSMDGSRLSTMTK